MRLICINMKETFNPDISQKFITEFRQFKLSIPFTDTDKDKETQYHLLIKSIIKEITGENDKPTE